MAAVQVLRKAIKDKKELRDKYLATLRNLNNQVRDKQTEVDRLEAEIVTLNKALDTIKTGESDDSI